MVAQGNDNDDGDVDGWGDKANKIPILVPPTRIDCSTPFPFAAAINAFEFVRQFEPGLYR